MEFHPSKCVCDVPQIASINPPKFSRIKTQHRHHTLVDESDPYLLGWRRREAAAAPGWRIDPPGASTRRESCQGGRRARESPAAQPHAQPALAGVFVWYSCMLRTRGPCRRIDSMAVATMRAPNTDVIVGTSRSNAAVRIFFSSSRASGSATRCGWRWCRRRASSRPRAWW